MDTDEEKNAYFYVQVKPVPSATACSSNEPKNIAQMCIISG